IGEEAIGRVGGARTAPRDTLTVIARAERQRPALGLHEEPVDAWAVERADREVAPEAAQQIGIPEQQERTEGVLVDGDRGVAPVAWNPRRPWRPARPNSSGLS